jgi:GntR family transcriptional regulator
VGPVPIEFAPPKYAVIVNTIQERIGDGTYPPGGTLPSEAALVGEFKVSRPTVVRALELLRQQGWIDAHHGKGRTVRGKPPAASRRPPVPASALLDEPEAGSVRLVSVGAVVAPPRIASLLGLSGDAAVIARRRLVVTDGAGPVELGTVYVPVELAVGTGVGEPAPLVEGLLPHLSKAKGVTFDHAVQRISARTPTAVEAELLDTSRREALLCVLLAVCDRAGVPQLVIDVQMPGTRHELEDVFEL